MSGRTPFAGLTVFDPGESVTEDNGRFLVIDPLVVAQILKIGAITHRHNAHAALTDPTADPTLAAFTTGGVIPADTAIYVGYTLVDPDGGETLLNTNPQLINTQAGLQAPTSAPTGAADHTAGTLLADTYYYALTVVDSGGGETPIGPSAAVTIDPGYANSRTLLSGLDTIVSDCGGVSWRLWRGNGGSQWFLLDHGTTATYTDNGSVIGDATQTPPEELGTTNSTNRFTVVVPTHAGATSFKIYASLDGSFESPCLLATYPSSDFGTTKTFTALNLLSGEPPAVSLALPGANKIDPDTELVGWYWKRPVANAAALPSSGNQAGDTRLTLDDLGEHTWSGSAWVLRGSLTTGHTIQEEGTGLTQRGVLNFVGTGVTATDDGTAKTVVTIPGIGARQAVAAAGGTAPAFSTNWANHAAGLGPVVSFWVDGDGQIHLEGLAVKSTVAPADGDVIFQLPSGFRPPEISPFAVVTGDGTTARAFGAVDISTTGDVIWKAGQAGATPFVSLNGICFRP